MRINEIKDTNHDDNAWVLVQNRKIIKYFKASKKAPTGFTSSRNQEIMLLSKAKKMGINEVTNFEKKDDLRDFDVNMAGMEKNVRKLPSLSGKGAKDILKRIKEIRTILDKEIG